MVTVIYKITAFSVFWHILMKRNKKHYRKTVFLNNWPKELKKPFLVPTVWTTFAQSLTISSAIRPIRFEVQ